MAQVSVVHRDKIVRSTCRSPGKPSALTTGTIVFSIIQLYGSAPPWLTLSDTIHDSPCARAYQAFIGVAYIEQIDHNGLRNGQRRQNTRSRAGPCLEQHRSIGIQGWA